MYGEAAYRDWLNDTSLRYIMSLDMLIKDELEEYLDSQDRNDFMRKILQLSTNYTNVVVAKFSEESKNMILDELRMKGLIV